MLVLIICVNASTFRPDDPEFQELTEEIFHALNANEGLYQWIAQSPILLPQAAQTYYTRFRGFPCEGH